MSVLSTSKNAATGEPRFTGACCVARSSGESPDTGNVVIEAPPSVRAAASPGWPWRQHYGGLALVGQGGLDSSASHCDSRPYWSHCYIWVAPCHASDCSVPAR